MVMTRAEKNIRQDAPTFELLGIGKNGLIPSKEPTAKTDVGATGFELDLENGWFAGSHRHKADGNRSRLRNGFDRSA
jgi:hypothetical protein